jgi:tetratricopeptide (TPR) repeat protein
MLTAQISAAQAEALHDAGRFDEALAMYRALLARDPFNVPLHNDYNDLLYRLDRHDEFLKSFDRAPPNRGLWLAKAAFLMHGRRHEEAREVLAAILKREPDNKHAATGMAAALSRLGRHDQAASLFADLTRRHSNDAGLCGNAAQAAIARGDAKAALAFCERGRTIAPDNQACLALSSLAYRLSGDERDETLNGYDRFIRIFDLEPPRGFSGMAEFNTALNAWLDRLHPHRKEHIAQSLRGGSQTVDQVFGAGHDLIDRLQQRMDEAVAAYIGQMAEDTGHPFLSRKARSFSYSGSWSSRLHDQGFHANHFHPEGWISSCYYVAVPEVVKDGHAKQGWIKFGEPDFPIPLQNPIRRAIEPAAGRLILFPSYMWHGTIPFHAAISRTTIAFDVMPQ